MRNSLSSLGVRRSIWDRLSRPTSSEIGKAPYDNLWTMGRDMIFNIYEGHTLTESAEWSLQKIGTYAVTKEELKIQAGTGLQPLTPLVF